MILTCKFITRSAQRRHKLGDFCRCDARARQRGACLPLPAPPNRIALVPSHVQAALAAAPNHQAGVPSAAGSGLAIEAGCPARQRGKRTPRPPRSRPPPALTAANRQDGRTGAAQRHGRGHDTGNPWFRSRIARTGICVKAHRAAVCRDALGAPAPRYAPIRRATRSRCANDMCRPHLLRRQRMSSAECAHSRASIHSSSRSHSPAPKSSPRSAGPRAPASKSGNSLP